MRSFVTADSIARTHRISARTLREALRAAGLPWHAYYGRWIAERHTPEHHDMERVAKRLQEARVGRPPRAA